MLCLVVWGRGQQFWIFGHGYIHMGFDTIHIAVQGFFDFLVWQKFLPLHDGQNFIQAG